MPPQRPIVANIVSQHLEDAASLRSARSVLVRAPHVKLLQLGRTDERLLAHLDGLSVAGDAGYDMARAALDVPDVGRLFVMAVLAVERRDRAQIDRLLALQDALPDATRALASAFGWLPAPLLRGIATPLLDREASAAQRWLGITACALHGVDPGAALPPALEESDARLRQQALRAIARSGRTDLLGACLAGLNDPDPACRLAAAWSAALLGGRQNGALALQALTGIALGSAFASPIASGSGGPGQAPNTAATATAPSAEALQLALLAAEPDAARRIVRQLTSDRAQLRITIQAAAWAGDLRAVPWLLQHMADDKHGRVAAEAFSFITGADLALLDLERKPPQDHGNGPTEDPDQDDVALDADESLPWPDPARVSAWWQRHADRLPQGERCFVGGRADAAHVTAVLNTGTQRQRHAAALLRSLMHPGTALFNVAAPTHRQQRLLAARTDPAPARSWN